MLVSTIEDLLSEVTKQSIPAMKTIMAQITRLSFLSVESSYYSTTSNQGQIGNVIWPPTVFKILTN
ncbi:MAG: hypothetical protein DRI01_07355 [Chloroflexi bacterium]|nr:MAG: hypothetical protein DRI01_07355 [Chloroflexota bacterium]